MHLKKLLLLRDSDKQNYITFLEKTNSGICNIPFIIIFSYVNIFKKKIKNKVFDNNSFAICSTGYLKNDITFTWLKYLDC